MLNYKQKSTLVDLVDKGFFLSLLSTSPLNILEKENLGVHPQEAHSQWTVSMLILCRRSRSRRPELYVKLSNNWSLKNTSFPSLLCHTSCCWCTCHPAQGLLRGYQLRPVVLRTFFSVHLGKGDQMKRLQVGRSHVSVDLTWKHKLPACQSAAFPIRFEHYMLHIQL